MENTKKITEEERRKNRDVLESFLKEVLACDIKELYSLLLTASWCLRDMFESTKKQEYLKKSERLKTLYTKLYPYVFDFRQ